jgi:hypothetical protein
VGGAIGAIDSALQITGCQFTRNSAPSAGSRFQVSKGMGGAILLSNTPAVIQTSRFRGNKSGTAGAIFTDSPLTLVKCNLDGNSALGATSYGGTQSALGGAVCNVSTNVLHISESTFSRNQALGGSGGSPGGANPPGPSLGGGIYSFPGLLTLTNCSIVLNQVIPPPADLFSQRFGLATGAGIYCSDAVMEYTTVASNWVQGSNSGLPGLASNVAGIFSENGAVILHAVILSNEGTNAFGNIIDSGYNLASDDSIAFTQPTSRAATDPRLGSFHIPDGFGGYFVPLPESPAIDSADPTQFPSTDLRGVSRPYRSRADIGAIETTLFPVVLAASQANHLILSFVPVWNTPITIEQSGDLSVWSELQTIPSNESLSIKLPQTNSLLFYRIKQPSN